MKSTKQTTKGSFVSPRAWWKPPWLFGSLLVIATLIAYLPALQGKFVWDDVAWTSNVSGLLRDFSGLRVMWSTPTALQQYYPLTGTTFWLDYQLWGFRTLPYHVENVLLHACAALLFWRLLRRLQVPGAWLASAIFALHPVMVESVAWITERKNVLSLVFYLGALLVYGRFTRFWQGDDNTALAAGHCPSRRWGAYALALLLFLAAYLSKATAFSFPPVLLLICWWQRGRLRWRTDVLPSLPFFALAIGLGLATAWLERNHVGAKGEEWIISFSERCVIAGRALWFYMGKLLWPADLCLIYPRWQLNPGSLAQWLYPATAGGAILAVWLARRRLGRGPVTAVLFFVGTLFPVLGFLNVYFMRYSFVCDHWAYLPSLGIIALGAALVVRALAHLQPPKILYTFAALILLLLAGLTWQQSKLYLDPETLWRTTIAKTPGCWLAYNNLGDVLRQRGQVDQAIVQVQKALTIQPKAAEAHNHLGDLLLQKGNLDDAILHFQRALAIHPAYWEVHLNLGALLLQRGQLQQAIAHLQKVLEIHASHPQANYNLGVALLRQGQWDDAIAHFQKALEIRPDFAEASYNLGNALLQKGQVSRAIDRFQKALKIRPGFADASYNLGNALLQQGRVHDAIACYQQAIEAQPANAYLLNNLAWVLATCPNASARNGARAVELAQQALRLSGGQNPWMIGTLAAAYAEDGRFPEAVTTARRALDLAAAQTNNAQVGALRSQINLYQAGSPIRDDSQTRPAANPNRPSPAD